MQYYYPKSVNIQYLLQQTESKSQFKSNLSLVTVPKSFEIQIEDADLKTGIQI